MFEYDRIDISEDINTNKTGNSDKAIICNYCLLLRINFKFQSNVYDGWHKMTKRSKSFGDIAFVIVKRHDCRINFWFMSKSDDIDRMKNATLNEEGGQLWL